MVVGLIIDIILMLICLIVVIKNAVNGFIKSFMGFARAILAVFIAYIFNAPLARLLKGWFFDGLSEKWILDAFGGTYNEGTGLYELYNVFDGIPDWFVKFITKFGIDENTTNTYLLGQEAATEETMRQITSGLSIQLSNLVSTVVAVLVLFILIQILLIFVGKLLEKVGDLPVFRVLNVLLGACIGAVIAALMVWLLSEGIIWLLNFAKSYNEGVFGPITDQSIFLRYFRDNNVWEIARGWFD